MCTRVGVLDRGRLVLQERLDVLHRPTGRVAVHTTDPAGVRALLDGAVEHQDGDRLLVRAPDAAELNGLLVRAGIQVLELTPERHTLEDIVLAATETLSGGRAGPASGEGR